MIMQSVLQEENPRPAWASVCMVLSHRDTHQYGNGIHIFKETKYGNGIGIRQFAEFTHKYNGKSIVFLMNGMHVSVRRELAP